MMKFCCEVFVIIATSGRIGLIIGIRINLNSLKKIVEEEEGK